jgi:ABC-type glycerol-3-phosphate transport system permease component
VDAGGADRDIFAGAGLDFAPGGEMTRGRTNIFAITGLHVVVALLALGVITPLLWLVCAAFKNGFDLFSYAFLPWGHLDHLTLDNFRMLAREQPFFRWMANSVFLTCLQTVLVVTFSSMGGFALAKYRFFGRRLAMVLMGLTMLLPSQVLLPSMYELVYHLGWMNSYAAIVVPGCMSVFGIFLFHQAMGGVPDELLWAARVDGCSEIRLWWEISLPIVRPMTGAFTLMSFLGAWNSFLWPQIVLQDARKFTLPIGLASLLGLPEYQAHYGILMAGTMLAIVPVVVVFFVLQKDFIAGLSSGAIKG